MNKHPEEINALLCGRKFVAFRRDEYWIFWGLILACRMHRKGNREALWNTETVKATYLSAGISLFDPSQYMSITCVCEIKRCIPYMYANKEKKGKDVWCWQIVDAFQANNDNWQDTIASSTIKTLDEEMFSFCLQTEKTGNLPLLSFILRKAEPLDIEVTNGLCAYLQIILVMTLCWAKNDAAPTGLDDSAQRKVLCITLHLMKRAKQNCSDKDEDDQNINQDVTPDVFLGDAWFSSVELCLLAKRNLGVHYIWVVKTNSSRHPKAFLQNQMNIGQLAVAHF